MLQPLLRSAQIVRIEDDVTRRLKRELLPLRNLNRREPNRLAHERNILLHSFLQLRKHTPTALPRLLKWGDRMCLPRVAVRLPPRAVLVGNLARLHLNRENTVARMKHEKVRLPLHRRPYAIPEPAVGVKHRIVISERLECMIRQPLPLTPMKIPYMCGIKSCHGVLLDSIYLFLDHKTSIRYYSVILRNGKVFHLNHNIK